MTLAIPQPTIIRTPCEQCRGDGYIEGETCGYCKGRGVIPTELVACPVHGLMVARDPAGGLLGKCDRCAGEAARALKRLTRNTTGPGRSILGDRATGARRDSS